MGQEAAMKHVFFEEETKSLINKEKKIFIDTLVDISKRVYDSQTFDDFLINSKEKNGPVQVEIRDDSKKRCLMWFNMKIIGVLFMIFYITGIYLIVGFMDSIMEEIKASASLYLSNTTRTANETFYDHYNQINLEMPKFSLYFLTSSLSGKIFNCMGIYFQSILIFVFNAAIYIGVSQFDFHIEPENINEKYSIWQFLFLVLMYVLLYASIGLVSMLPHYIYFTAFDKFEDWYSRTKDKKNFGGSFLGFYISILFSMAIKYLLNQYLIVQNKEDSDKFYSGLFVYYLYSIILALIFYFIFSFIFVSNIPKKEDKKKSKSGCRLLGCIVYSESEDNPINIKCEGIRKGCRKCYVNCFCHLCCCCKCFACNNCCCCCDNKTNIELSEAINRDKMICIIYKTTGIISWFCNLLTNRFMIIFILIMYFLQIINYGFRETLSNYLSNCEDSEITIINLLGLAGILLFYFLVVLPGCICAKCFEVKKVDEGTFIGYGLLFNIIPAGLISFIFSILIHYDIIGDIRYYLMPFSIGSIEFYLILLKRISGAFFPTEFFSADYFISLYIIFWNIFTLILELSNVSSSKLIFMQFVLLSILIPILLILISLYCYCGKKIIKSQEIENKEEVFISDNKDEIKEDKEE